MLKRPNIFAKSRSIKDFKYDILTSQPDNFVLVNQTRPDQSGQTKVVRPKWSDQRPKWSDHFSRVSSFLSRTFLELAFLLLYAQLYKVYKAI